MPEVNGKQIALRDRLTGKDWWALAPVMASFAELGEDATPKELLRCLEWEELCTLVQVMVVTWELEGEPGDPEFMDTLGLDLYAISRPCIQRLLDLTPAPGEAGSAST